MWETVLDARLQVSCNQSRGRRQEEFFKTRKSSCLNARGTPPCRGTPGGLPPPPPSAGWGTPRPDLGRGTPPISWMGYLPPPPARSGKGDPPVRWMGWMADKVKTLPSIIRWMRAVKILVDMCLFVGLPIPLFWTSGGVCPEFTGAICPERKHANDR